MARSIIIFLLFLFSLGCGQDNTTRFEKNQTHAKTNPSKKIPDKYINICDSIVITQYAPNSRLPAKTKIENALILDRSSVQFLKTYLSDSIISQYSCCPDNVFGMLQTYSNGKPAKNYFIDIAGGRVKENDTSLICLVPEGYQFIIKIPKNKWDKMIKRTMDLISSSQKNYPPPPPGPFDINTYESDSKCYHNKNLSFNKRKKIYPFNKAASVQVISFNSRLEKTPIAHDSLISKQVIEKVKLSEMQLDSLTDILYNYNFSRNSPHTIDVNGCYYPRHAILFFNASGKIFEFIEICLQCRQIESQIPEKYLGEFCEGKYDLLKNFFVSIGITHFTDNTDALPPPPPPVKD